jgi:rhomboid family GlyGly-CTERM serine protease
MSRERATASRWPWATLLLSAVAVGVHLAPAAAACLQYDRAALAGGEPWRLLTGHWVHWSAEHLAWDVLVLAAAGAALESAFGRRALVLTVLLSALAISAAVWLLHPELALYRGLSGVDCALVVAASVCHLRTALERGDRGLAALLAVVLALWGAKVSYEALTGRTLFVAAGGAFVPVFLAHLVGGACGLVTSLARPTWPRVLRDAALRPRAARWAGSRNAVPPPRTRRRARSTPHPAAAARAPRWAVGRQTGARQLSGSDHLGAVSGHLTTRRRVRDSARWGVTPFVGMAPLLHSRPSRCGAGAPRSTWRLDRWTP